MTPAETTELGTAQPNPLSLPDNIRALLSLSEKTLKECHRHSCYLWYGGELCYITAGVSAAFILFHLVQATVERTPTESFHDSLLNLLLYLFFLFSVASVASAGYLLRNIRTQNAKRITSALAVATLIVASPFCFNPFTIIIIGPIAVLAALILQAALDRLLYSESPLSHAQIRYCWQSIKEQKPIEENEIPQGRTPGKHDKLHTVLSAYCIALPFILIGLLLIPSLIAAKDHAIQVTCRENLRSLYRNLERYQSEHNAYPRSLDEIQANPPLICPYAKKTGKPYEFAPDYPPKDSSSEPRKTPLIVCRHHPDFLFILWGDGRISSERKPSK